MEGVGGAGTEDQRTHSHVSRQRRLDGQKGCGIGWFGMR
jgi:hypothetical protein